MGSAYPPVLFPHKINIARKAAPSLSCSYSPLALHVAPLRRPGFHVVEHEGMTVVDSASHREVALSVLCVILFKIFEFHFRSR